MKWSAISAILALAGVVSAGVVARDDAMSPLSEKHQEAKRVTPTALVTVGGANGNGYAPSALSGLSVGDVVRFTLATDATEQHTVTQAVDANNPCTAAPGGFTHLFDPADSTTWTYDITVLFATPLHAFCAIPGHCTDGMKFTVNA